MYLTIKRIKKTIYLKKNQIKNKLMKKMKVRLAKVRKIHFLREDKLLNNKIINLWIKTE